MKKRREVTGVRVEDGELREVIHLSSWTKRPLTHRRAERRRRKKSS